MSYQLTPLRGRGLFGIASVSWGCYPQDRLMRIPKVQVHGLRFFKPLHDTKGSGTSVPRTSEYDHQNPMILKFRLQHVDFLCGETCNIQYVFDSESFGFHLTGIV